jgi:membrane-associated phospholipid phosphatase
MKAFLALLLWMAPALQAAEGRRSAWDESRPRFRTSEYVITALALAGSAANFYLVIPPQSPVWDGGIVFDDASRNTLRARSESGRSRAKDMSNLLTYPLIGYAMLDGPITAGWVGGSKETAIQLSLINAEIFAITEVLNLTVSKLVPRSRPEGAVCDPGSQYDPHCVRSFWSGHAANVFAAASLVCVEHGALDLYGGKADAAACGASLAAASAVGLLRIVSNDHYASDVIVGAAVGAATGYLMPNLLHFQFKRSSGRLGALIPHVGPAGGGLTYVKAW